MRLDPPSAPSPLGCPDPLVQPQGRPTPGLACRPLGPPSGAHRLIDCGAPGVSASRPSFTRARS